MRRLRNYYIRNIKQQVGAEPIWPVNARYSLGDYGFYRKRTGRFSVRGNIFDDLGVPRRGVVVPSADLPSELYKIVNSASTIKNEFTINASHIPAKGMLALDFSGEKSYLFQLFRAQVSHLKLNETVKKALQKAQSKGIWDYRYRIIELIYECPDVRFLYSMSSNAKIRLAGEVELGQIPTKGNIDYNIQHSSNMDGSLWIKESPSTPFAHFASFKKRELLFEDEKVIIGKNWDLMTDNSGSFDDDWAMMDEAIV